MAHIPDGILSLPVLVGGAAIATAGVGLALKHLDETTIPRTAILAAVFFTTSLIAIPIGPASIHLVLSSLMGLTLGILTFPAVLIGLILQATLFGFGGLTSLGFNTANIALPGVVFAALFSGAIARAPPARAGVLAAAVAALSIGATGLGVSIALALSSSDYAPTAKIILATYIPLIVIEALITGACVVFLKRVKPELLKGYRA